MKMEDNLRVARLTGWVLLLLPAALAALLLVSAYNNGAFERKQGYLLLAPSAENIKAGTPLEFAGFPIGSVAAVRLDNSGLAEISLNVAERNARWLRSDSLFVLQQPLLGSAKIEVQSPDLRSPALPAGATRRLQSHNAMEALQAQLKPILADLKTLSAALTDPAGPLLQTLAHVEKISGSMASHGVIGALTANPATATEFDQSVKQARLALQKINAAIDQTQAHVFGKEGMADQAQAGLAEAVKALLALRENLQGLTRVIGHGERLAANLADGSAGLTELRGDIDLALRRTNETLRRIEGFLADRPQPLSLP